MVPTEETKKLRAFHSDKSLKSMMLKELKWHQDQDAIVQGTYGEEGKENFKGCAVGCSIHSLNVKLGKHHSTRDHKVYETDLGIPEALAYLEDNIFEKLTPDTAKKFPFEFIKAIPVGADLSLVAPKFIIFVLNDVLVNADDAGKKAINDVIKLWTNVTLGKKVESAAWSAAWSAARSAAESAAWSAAESAARSAARSAAESAARSAAWSAARSAAWSAAESAAESAARSAAESAAWSAAESAAWSAAESAAWSAAYGKYKNHLIKLLKTAPVK